MAWHEIGTKVVTFFLSCSSLSACAPKVSFSWCSSSYLTMDFDEEQLLVMLVWMTWTLPVLVSSSSSKSNIFSNLSFTTEMKWFQVSAFSLRCFLTTNSASWECKVKFKKSLTKNGGAYLWPVEGFSWVARNVWSCRFWQILSGVEYASAPGTHVDHYSLEI